MQLVNGISSNYSLSLVSYALSLANSLSAQSAIDELMSRADIRGNVHSAYQVKQITLISPIYFLIL